jgi:two-component system, OmpR family, alkaline phosphatase synthesis response regulator PhoP
MSRILLVEDEEHLAQGLAYNLRNAGYDVEIAGSGEDALEKVERQGFDLILLDVMLPGISGIEVARGLRKAEHIQPIVMLSAKDRTADAIAGLDAGADDYITKPFDLDEVLARVRGALRRQVWGRAFPNNHAPESLEFGRWRIDFQSFLATGPEGQELKLSPKELGILRLFAARPGEVISRETFLEEVWGMPGSLETRTVDNFIRKLRQALEEHPSRPRHITSIRGAGYRFVP